MVYQTSIVLEFQKFQGSRIRHFGTFCPESGLGPSFIVSEIDYSEL